MKKRRARVNLVGETFGTMIVREMLPRQACRCDCNACGKAGLIKKYYHLESGKNQSCGCLTGKLISKTLTRHGHSPRSGESAEYRIWTGMMQRCTNRKHEHYEDYGGRGISVDDRWLNFETFLEDMGAR